MPHTLVGCPYFRRAFGWSVPIGGLAVAYAPVEGLKLLLGLMLIGAAAKTIASRR